MASFCSTSMVAPSASMKIVAYVPQAPKLKPKSRAKLTVAAQKPEYNSPAVAPFKDAKHRYNVDEFPKGGASRPLEPGVSGLLGLADVSGSPNHGLNTAGGLVEAKKLKHHPSSWESLVEDDAEHAASIGKTDPAPDELFDGNYLESPLNPEADSVEALNNAAQVQPSSRSPTLQRNTRHATARTDQDRAEQHDDLDLTSMRAAVSHKESIHTPLKEPSPGEDASIFGVDVWNKVPSTQKRGRKSSHDTTTPSAEVLDIASGFEQEDHASAKRRRLSERQAENPALDYIRTPKSLLPSPRSPESPARTDYEPSPSFLHKDTQGGGDRSLVTSPRGLGKDNGDGGPHAQGTARVPAHSSRQSVSPFEGTEGEQNRECVDDEDNESVEDEVSQIDEPFYRNPARASCRRRNGGPSAEEKTHGPLQTATRSRDSHDADEGLTASDDIPRTAVFSAQRRECPPVLLLTNILPRDACKRWTQQQAPSWHQRSVSDNGPHILSCAEGIGCDGSRALQRAGLVSQSDEDQT